ncbi:O-methyltransferase [Penicillium angulare]|uniref:O-methyltransferase n=1 Tax=Penicillium angulare TaxID=116970 RepID=A0A9W9GDB4_9EURO|nr:O-methyltransferase [Penicillium angulare]
MAAETSGRANLRQALELAGAHFINLVEIGILKTFIDNKVFDRIPEDGDISFQELANTGESEVALLERFCNYLVAAEILESPSPGRVAHTDRSRAYKTGEIPAGFIQHVFNFLLRPVACWPAYFDENGLAAPKTVNKIPLGLATGYPDSDLYGVLDKEPVLAKLFNGAMRGSAKIYSLNGVYSFDWMKNASSGERPAVVDIGGGSGVALQDIVKDNRFISPESCAVFDLPTVIEDTKSERNGDLHSLQLIGGSMFEALPKSISNSLVYTFRRVLNDFPDEDVVNALEQVRKACAPDSRVLIIEEMLHPNRSKFSIAQDIFVMNFGGKRRSESMFRDLAAKTGFHVSSVVEDKATDFGVVELVPVSEA